MKIKVTILVPMAGDPMFNPGDKYECDEAEAVRLVRAGMARGPKGWQLPPEPIEPEQVAEGQAGKNAGSEPA